ncbi:MAG: trimethylamine methyltransferase family protein, partial [Desulfatiglandales bacterium]|nr:trimethylamine methyltransferase family protein [Desulfatiglandales bacterium]
MTREGVVVDPYKRLNQEPIERIHQASLQILMDPGIICLNKRAAELFGDAGADVTPITHDGKPAWILKIPEKIISEGIKNAPKKVTLGARDINNSLFLDGKEPRVRFASGSEANNWLDIDVETFISKNNPEKEINIPVFRVEKGNTDKLAQAAHLCENLDSWDSFLRTVNLQDDDITDENKDITKFFVALNNTTKHVMAGLTEISQLENVIKMAQLIAGGEEALKKNPLISFITCVVKSPLQLTNDPAETAIEVAKRGLPLVISSSPQGGSTAPIKEEGMVAQINAEILTGIT